MKKLNLLFTALLLMCCVGNAKAERVTINRIKYDVITDTKQATVIRGYYSGDIVIPSEITYNNVTYSVTSIGEEAFFWCDGLTSITIPNSVTSIGKEAFYDCSGLKSITIPSSVTSIGERAFDGCSGLTSITIPNSVTSIEDYAFEDCSGLTSVTIGNSVTSIGRYAFSGCSGLTSVIIGNSVTSIGDWAFSDCEGLTSVIIGNSVTSIGKHAFYSCDGLKTVYNCSNLTFSKGSNGYGLIAYYADNVYNAPNGSIEGDYIFCKLYNVNTLLFYFGNETELTLPADYKGESYVIGGSAFAGNNTITSITIPNSVTSIRWSAFLGCDGLTSVTIGNKVTSIGESAFGWCERLTSVIIGNSVTSIGESAFANCDNITDIKVMAEKPIRSNANIFSNAVYDNATLYIPAGTKSLYEKREPWNLFFDIAETDFTGIDDINAENGNVKTIYDLQGRRVENPTEGIYIVNGKKIFIK